MRLLPAALLTLALTAAQTSTPGHAQSFKPQVLPPVATYTAFECVLLKESSSDNRDPIYKIVVDLTLNDAGQAIDLVVVHHARSGQRYNRADQYINGALSQTPHKTEYFWTGTWIRNTSHRMRGAIFRVVEGNWFYTEQVTEYGGVTYQMVSQCHVQ